MQPGQQSIQLAKAKAADAERFAWEQRLLAWRSRRQPAAEVVAPATGR